MRKRSRDFLFILAFVIVIAAVVLDKTALKPVRTRLIESKQRGPDGTKYHAKTFTVTYIVDGDTFDIDIPDGEKEVTRIRPLGIDTPETKHPKYPPMYYGDEATAFAEKLLLNKKVTIEIDTVSKSRDIYGRLLCFIRLSDGRDFHAVMIREGFAYSDLRFEHGRYDEYVELQKQAVRNRAGLWDKVEKSQFPPWLKREYPDILQLRD